jgi:two-component sensor histidine kinase
VSLDEIVRQELASYSIDSDTTIEGPEVMLVPEASQAAATVLHELATNAAKYGALSVAGGHVRVEWRFGDRADGPSRLLTW